jgi:site-specific recombinase XerD
MSLLAPTLQSFFTTYLTGQRGASAHTVAAYRDTWRLLLTYLSSSRHLHPSGIGFTDLDAEAVTSFLTYLETGRGNSTATRNARLAAIHAFFGYAAYLHPEHADLIGRVLAIRAKNAPKTQISYLTDAEVDALLASPPEARWVGRRDRLIILTLVTTGLRISELTHLTWADLRLSRPAHVACQGKGRKERITPLDTATARALQVWYAENPSPAPASPVFTAQGRGRPMTTDAVAQRLRVHATAAVTICPTLAAKSVTPHILRHTTAMRMLAAGIDTATICLWLGHESIESTQAYLHADLGIKQRALDRTAPPDTRPGRYTPADTLLEFLENL